jgi:hypothetical protein
LTEHDQSCRLELVKAKLDELYTQKTNNTENNKMD